MLCVVCYFLCVVCCVFLDVPARAGQDESNPPDGRPGKVAGGVEGMGKVGGMEEVERVGKADANNPLGSHRNILTTPNISKIPDTSNHFQPFHTLLPLLPLLPLLTSSIGSCKVYVNRGSGRSEKYLVCRNVEVLKTCAMKDNPNQPNNPVKIVTSPTPTIPLKVPLHKVQ